MIGEKQIRKQEEKAREAFRWLMLAEVTLVDATMGRRIGRRIWWRYGDG